ncbi:MAG: hypothetical protein ABIK61_01070 [candidate division WOR-3 bacterium]
MRIYVINRVIPMALMSDVLKQAEKLCKNIICHLRVVASLIGL